MVDEYDYYDRADLETSDEGEDDCSVYNLEHVFYLIKHLFFLSAFLLKTMMSI